MEDGDKGKVGSMTLEKQENGTDLTITLSGRLDTMTSRQLEAELSALEGKSFVTLNFSGIDYVSSAGLRVLLAMQKKMNAARGRMKLIHVKSDVNDIFEMTGFADILTIEP